MRLVRPALALTLCGAALLAPAAQARPGAWGGSEWGGSSRDRESAWADSRRSSSGSVQEGKVEVTRFVATGSAAAALGHGTLAAGAAAAGPGDADPRELATFEAAVLDQLTRRGYDTASTAAAAGQLAEVRVLHDVAVPEEAPRKPVSGAMEVGVGSHGSSMGMALMVDLTKPKRALLSTRLEARIRDKLTNEVLWEGRAEMATREGSERWSEQAIATKLAEALFAEFPGTSPE